MKQYIYTRSTITRLSKTRRLLRAPIRKRAKRDRTQITRYDSHQEPTIVIVTSKADSLSRFDTVLRKRKSLMWATTNSAKTDFSWAENKEQFRNVSVVESAKEVERDAMTRRSGTLTIANSYRRTCIEIQSKVMAEHLEELVGWSSVANRCEPIYSDGFALIVVFLLE